MIYYAPSLDARSTEQAKLTLFELNLAARGLKKDLRYAGGYGFVVTTIGC